jgi:hypothetical protein
LLKSIQDYPSFVQVLTEFDKFDIFEYHLAAFGIIWQELANS